MADKLATLQVLENIRRDVDGHSEEFEKRTVRILSEGLDAPVGSPAHIDPNKVHWGSVMESLLNSQCKTRGGLIIDMQTSDLALIAEAVVASGFPTVFKKAIHNVWMPEYENNLMGASNLVTEVDSDREEENVPGIQAADEPELVPEGRPVPETQLKEKYALIKNKLFQRSIDFTRHTLLFDKSGGRILERARRYGEKMGQHRHRFIVQKTMDWAVDATGEAADTALLYAGSAVAMYSSDHSAIDNQTNVNATTNDFSSANMQQAIQYLGLMKDEAGSETPVFPDTVLCSFFLLTPAIELAKAPGRFDSANRTLNVWGPNGLQTMDVGFTGFNIVATPVIDNYHANGKYYWNVGKHKNNMRWQWVMRPKVEEIPGDMRRNIIMSFLGQYFGGCGAVDYRYAIRNLGTDY